MELDMKNFNVTSVILSHLLVLCTKIIRTFRGLDHILRGYKCS